MNLSEHFTLDEFTASQEAARRGIDNTPSPQIVETLRVTARGLEQVREKLGGLPIIVSSGYRCPALNTAVGGQRWSQHMIGQAVDFICPHFGPPEAVAKRLRGSGIEYDQLIIEYADKGGGWVHISFADEPRHQALRIDSAGTRPMA